MCPRLEPTLRPEQAYWVRNLSRWILGEDESPDVALVTVRFCSLVRPRLACVETANGARHYVGFFALASSPARLRRMLAKWDAAKAGERLQKIDL